MNEVGTSKDVIAGPSAWDKLTASESHSHPIQGPPKPPDQGAPINYGEELNAELVQQGWKKFWSKRENRPYFWNKISGESMWEMPQLGGNKFDIVTDPLGICNPNGHNNAPLGPPPTHSLKRRASEDAVPISPLGPPQSLNAHPNLTPHHPPLKKFVLAGPWDLEIGSNVVSTFC